MSNPPKVRKTVLSHKENTLPRNSKQFHKHSKYTEIYITLYYITLHLYDIINRNVQLRIDELLIYILIYELSYSVKMLHSSWWRFHGIEELYFLTSAIHFEMFKAENSPANASACS